MTPSSTLAGRVLSAFTLSLALLNPPTMPTADAHQPVPERGADGDKLDKLARETAKKVLADTVSEIQGRIKNGKAIKEEAVIGAWVTAAASSALKQDAPEEVRQKAFLIAMGLSFENSDLVRALMGKELQALESDDERKTRLEVLKDATYGKKARLGKDMPFDKTQHFFFSGLLTATKGSAEAEKMGVLKEQADLVRGTGFGMGDLAANTGGILFAENLLAGKITLKELAAPFDAKKLTGFSGAKYFPPIPDFDYKEVLDRKGFEQKYGSTGSKEFLAERES